MNMHIAAYRREREREFFLYLFLQSETQIMGPDREKGEEKRLGGRGREEGNWESHMALFGSVKRKKVMLWY